MVKAGLSIVLVVGFALRASAADGPKKGERPRPKGIPVSVLLRQLAQSPLGPGEACLLRAVADLVEKEQAGDGAHSSSDPVIASAPSPASIEAELPMSGVQAAPKKQRARLAVRLSNVPAVDAAKAMEEFLNSDQKTRRAAERTANPSRAIIVCEPVTNSLLVSATPQLMDAVSKLISKLDTQPPVVAVDVCIAELLPHSKDGRAKGGSSDTSGADNAPSMEKDGAAWLAWAKKQGRLQVLSQPRVMTQDNQPAHISIGRVVPIGRPEPGTHGPAKSNHDQTEQVQVGLTVDVTPRVSPEGLVVVALDVERTSLVDLNGAAGPTIGRTGVQTTVSAKDGHTIIVGGLMVRAEDGHRGTIIAVTPRVNPKR